MAYSWCKVRDNPLDMKVVGRCADALSIPRAQALGHLVSLWSALSNECDDGVISRFTDDQLEDWAGWAGVRGAFALFVRNRHTDRRGKINEWDEFMGPKIAARASARRRQAARRARLKGESDPGKNGGSGPVHRDIGDIARDNSHVTGDNGNVTRDTPDFTRDRTTEVYKRKSLRDVGIYLSRVLELRSNSELRDEASSLSQNNLDGAELVRSWCRAFFAGDVDEMLGSLQTIRKALLPEGALFHGQRIHATPRIVAEAMREVLAHPPNVPLACTTILLLKLSGGHLHEVKTDSGMLVTEARAAEAGAIFRDVSKTLSEVPGLTDLMANIGKLPPAVERIAPRGARRDVPAC